MTKTDFNMEALQYTAAPVCGPVNPLNQNDAAALGEIAQAIKDAGYEDRFGVTILAKDFALESNEGFYETTDPEIRKSTLKIMARTEMSEGAVTTNWNFRGKDEAETAGVCVGYCYYNNGHRYIHNYR